MRMMKWTGAGVEPVLVRVLQRNRASRINVYLHVYMCVCVCVCVCVSGAGEGAGVAVRRTGPGGLAAAS